jgi:hypothetical protein
MILKIEGRVCVSAVVKRSIPKSCGAQNATPRPFPNLGFLERLAHMIRDY